MGRNGKVIILLVIIVACIAFIGYRMFGGSGGGGGTAPTAEAEQDLICTACGHHFTSKMSAEAFMPLMQQGANAADKVVCPECGKQAAVAAIQCSACNEWVPSPGMQAAMMMTQGGGKAPICPKCGKPLDLSKMATM